MPAGDLALGQVAVVAALVDRDLLLGEVELDDASDGARQELPVVADDHGRAAQTCHELLEPLQAVEVEVVGRLVEQQHVVAREQQRREPGPGRLPTGQRGHRRLDVDPEAQPGQGHGGPFLEVGATQREPRLERRGIPVVGAGPALAEGFGGGVHLRLGGADAGAAGDEGGHGLAGPTLGFLGQVPDRGGRRAQRDRALLGLELGGQQPQEGGLAGAVGPDEADDVARADDEVEPREEGPGAVAGGEVGGLQGRAHVGGDATRR